MARAKAPESAAIHVKVAGSDELSTFGDAFHVGRAADNDFIVEGDTVSEHHATVSLEDDGWHVRDADSTNGIIVYGRRVNDVLIESTTWVRLGVGGPALVMTVDGARDTRSTRDAALHEEHIAERYFASEAPEDMGAHTAMMRAVVKKEHRRRTHGYRKAMAALAVVLVATAALVLAQRRQLAELRAAAADIFYGIKEFELQIGALEMDSARTAAYAAQRDALRRRYRDHIEALGIYGEDTPERDRLIYQVIGRFGESEVNVPKEFLQDVQLAIRRWSRTERLSRAFDRANRNGYGSRIAQIMADHNLPPEFFYLALQESDFRTDAIGPETRFGYAKGMWQIMPGTARDLDLQTGPLVGLPRPDPQDERHDFEKASRAAAKYLRDIYRTDAQASGLLVMASYNWGQNNVIPLIRSLPPNPRERNYWRLMTRYRSRIPRETYSYIVQIVSAAVIGENPALFGFEGPAPLPRPLAAPSPDYIAPE